MTREEDDIEASKAPLLEHLLELRRRLMWSLLAILLAFLVCFWFAKPIYNLLLWPYRVAVGTDAGWFSKAAVAMKESAKGNS